MGERLRVSCAPWELLPLSLKAANQTAAQVYH